MGLLSDSRTYREALLARNLYRDDSSEYSLPDFGNGSLVARQFIPNYGSLSSLAQNILYGTPIGKIALRKLAEQLVVRTADEAFDEIVPLDLPFADGGVFKKEDLSITKTGNVKLIDRILNTNSASDIFTNQDYREAGTAWIDDKVFENTGKLQNLYYSRNIGENLYANRLPLTGIQQGNISYYLERRLGNINASYFSDLVYLKTSAEDIRLSQYNYSKKIDDPAYPISGILTDATKEEILKRDGEYGDYGVPSLKSGNCFVDYTMKDTYDIDIQASNNDPNSTIVWGLTPISTLENTFNAKRGLLRFTAEIAEMSNRAGMAIRQDSKCYTGLNGEVVYKANPCRNWTRTEGYGQVSTLIRSKGNGNPDSVNYDFVIPRIHPDGNNDGKNRYMFALENLAWTKADLIANNIPECEWGAMGGRLMWFPPYIESIDESASASWNDVQFVGRIEPMQIHNGTSRRTGSISFFLIMDYPQFADDFSVTPADMANLMLCDEDGIPKRTPFRGTTIPSGNTGLPVRVGNPVQPIDPISIATPNNGNVIDKSIPNVNYFFENDKYAYVTDYEKYASASVGNNLFALNAPFFGLPANNPNPSAVPTSGEPFLEKVSLMKQELDIDGKPFTYYYDITLEGNASEVFRGNQTTPSIYNVYLSFRRVFTIAKTTGSQSLTSSTLKLNMSESRLSEKTKKQLQKLYSLQTLDGLDITLINPNNMFPYDSTYPKATRQYWLELSDIFVFDEYDQSGRKGLRMILSASGSQGTGVGTGTQETRINLRRQKESRNVLINVARNQARISVADANSQTQQQIPPASGQQPQPQPSNNGQAQQQQAGQQQNPQSPSIPPCDDRFADDFRNATYDMIEERYGFRKLKYFARAFHSQTPEDYHRRLTFLHQLMRMGRSIAKDGAENSSFGRAPVAIMRVGDFFHTRIAISNISFNHGSGDLIWDLNGEGMGVQPMWTKVTMQYTIMGGEALSGPIDRLQNAVTFNYYANSTFYDSGVYASAKSQERDQLKIDEERRKNRV